MSAHLSVQYLLRGISDCIYKLFPGDRTAFESVDFVQSAAAFTLDTADFDSSALYGAGRDFIFRPDCGCGIGGHRGIFYSAGDEEIEQESGGDGLNQPSPVEKEKLGKNRKTCVQGSFKAVETDRAGGCPF